MRRLLAVCVVIGVVMAFGPYAEASGPLIVSFDRTFLFSLEGVCSFPLDVTDHLVGTRIRFRDETGALVKDIFYDQEQDTFSANGKSVTGEPYNFAVVITYENGEITSNVATGVAERIVLPDGTVFLSAGVIDFLAQGVGASLFTDPGVTGDIEALCAALSP
jgi:hypothetical protein